MEQPLKFGMIPEEKYPDYRYEVIFRAYKWDPQVEDHNTVAKQVLLMNKETARQLELWAEDLARETVMIEEALVKKLALAKKLGLPKDILKALDQLDEYDSSRNVRLMRFDFHPIDNGWAVSEVNSDVPGGMAEASVLPQIAAKYFDGYEPRKNIADSMVNAFHEKIKEQGTIAFVHATSYSDDRQVMEFLSNYFSKNKFKTFSAAPDHIKWKDKKAVSILEGYEGELDGIIRFFPLEWLTNLPKKSDWRGYYDTLTPSCNHPIAIFAQSKRLPLVWDKLGISIPTWKKLLPETLEPKAVNSTDFEYIFKPALGRVGEGISMKEAISDKEYNRILKAARKYPGSWLAQRKFISSPISAENRENYHLCVGVFTVDGRSAGFYGRISPYTRIDARAKDIPILVEK
ncbi:glutathionylspermidine synthase family protein [Anaerocolumna sp. AGMB13020]|uniref:glutathionylspermidine synthase family protein n=1 Tax=Anaerocolumna sp. AGMB13020 TaxID=3081750 RepID=UPI0029549BA9|nr:glutathionylspermidine synthase family protein [Anaerocolumna sp. AGMB13020]WOO37274.1 glutathionylspermidine synthase family protein [Anaerocolumna sp. AGMB13020]